MHISNLNICKIKGRAIIKEDSMKEYTVIQGNLLDSNTDFIAHQVNCQGVMGSGVAKAVRQKHMDVYNNYLYILEQYRNMGKQILGHAQTVYVNNCSYKAVINMFAQDKYGYDGKQYTSLEAFRSSLKEINSEATGKSVAFPWKIGCVRGGADWNTVLEMICTELTNVSQIVFYQL